MTRTILWVLFAFVLWSSLVLAQFVTQKPAAIPQSPPEFVLDGDYIPSDIPPPIPLQLLEWIEDEELLLEMLENWYPESIWFCEFSDQEQETVMMVRDLFEEYAESRIVQKLYRDSDVQELIRVYIDEFIRKSDAIIGMCQQWLRSQMNIPRNYDEFESGIMQFVEMLWLLKKRENTRLWVDPVAESFDSLRKLLVGDSEAYLLDDGWVSKTGKFLLDLSVQDSFSDVAINLDADSSSVWKKDATVLDAAFQVWGTIDITGDWDQIKTSGEMSAEMKILDGHLYIKLKDFDIALGDINFENQYDAAGFNEMLAWINVIQWKYIDIPLVPDAQDPFSSFNPFVGIGNPLQQQEMFLSLLYNNWLTTVDMQWDMLLAWMNPLACTAMKMMNEVSWCLNSWQSMSEMSPKGGMLFMKPEGDVMTMWVVPEFAAAIENDELYQIAGIPLLTWNNEKLLEINIPLYDEDQFIWWVSYKDNLLTIKAEFEEERYNYDTGDYDLSPVRIQVKWKTDADTMNLIGTVSWETMNVRFTLDLDWSLESMVGKMTLDLEDSSDYGTTVRMNMTFGQEMMDIDPVNITKPEDREILNLEELIRL